MIIFKTLCRPEGHVHSCFSCWVEERAKASVSQHCKQWHKNGAGLASGRGTKQLEDSPDGQFHMSMIHQWEAEGNIFNWVTRAMSRSQPLTVPKTVQEGTTPLVMQLGCS